MPVSSQKSKYRVDITKIERNAYPRLKNLFDGDQGKLNHSRTPACLTGAGRGRDIRLFEVYDDQDNLVVYFPFEESKFFGVTIIRPAFYELTLDFIDLTFASGWEHKGIEIFLDWVKSQKNSVVHIFMCDENSELTKQAIDDPNILVEQRGIYFKLDLPGTFEEFINGLSKSTRKSTLRKLKKFNDSMVFEVVRGKTFGDELSKTIDDFINLHRYLFPKNSAMLPHVEALCEFIEKGFTDDAVFFVRAREISSGNVIAMELMMNSATMIGLLQRGRRQDKQYRDIGNWLQLKTIEWAISEKKSRYEFLNGDQEYKRRLSTGVRDAVSLTYFSSLRAKYIFRIRQRLGRYFKNLR